MSYDHLLDDPEIHAIFTSHPYWRVNPEGQRVVRLRLTVYLLGLGYRPQQCAQAVDYLMAWHPAFWF